jgi:putative protein-disulfide isomerase
MKKLIYVADPMCSWCYGFGKEVTALMERHPEMKLEIVAGGLRPGGTEKLDDAGKQFRLTHWARVEAASGLPFNREGFLARQNFIYDTEPICRAFVAARMLAPEADLLSVFRALQRGFYVDALDTTDGKVLSDIGARALSDVGHPIDADRFHAQWSSQETIAATQADFNWSRSVGVQSFPVLIAEHDNRLFALSSGYTPVETLVENLKRLPD